MGARFNIFTHAPERAEYSARKKAVYKVALRFHLHVILFGRAGYEGLGNGLIRPIFLSITLFS